MRVADFDFSLPPELIASRSVEPRDQARLLVHDRTTRTIEHTIVAELPRFLRAGDSFEAAAIVSVKGSEAQDVDVSATASGLTLSGESSKRIHVEPGRSTEVKFPAIAMRSGSFDLKFDAKTSTSADSVTTASPAMTRRGANGNGLGIVCIVGSLGRSPDRVKDHSNEQRPPERVFRRPSHIVLMRKISPGGP